MMRKSRTLVETVAVIAVLGIIAGVSVHPLMKFYDLWWYNTNHMQLLWGARGALYDMEKNIRMINTDVYVATPTEFEFDIEDAGGSTVRVNYEFIGDVLYKDGNDFMDNVSSLAFTYYDASGNVLATPDVSPQDTDIREVEIDMTVATGGESIGTTTMVLCRNLID
jgi:hypothetical protein